MRKLSIALVCVLFVFSISGCNDSAKDNSGMQVTVRGGGKFPEYLAGKWVSDKVWEFNFEPNGVISSAVLNLGAVEVKPGQITKVPMLNGGEGVFEPGKWLVDYDPHTRELTIEVSLKDFELQMGGKVVLEGTSRDIFVGKVSESGDYWNSVWTRDEEFTAHTKDFPNYKLPGDPNADEVIPVVFEKVKNKN
jgi:hypothetical protein